jgi:hypothetical protein
VASASSFPLDDVPVSIEPIVGWRAWRLRREGGRLLLQSLVHGGAWPPQEVEPASCARHPRPHIGGAPHERCTCGYYATDSWESLCDAQVFNNGGIGVVGAIGMWGTVVEHAQGARSEFAYPARLRLVCAPCLQEHVVRDPVVVVDAGGGNLAPRCERHGRSSSGLPAKAVEWELLNTYGVELLPRPTIPRHVRHGIRFKPGMSKPAQVASWFLIAVFMTIRFLISAFFVLWLLAIALSVVAVVVGGAYRLVTGSGDDVATPVVQPPLSPVEAYIYRAERHLAAGVEPHRGKPRPPPVPRLALPCGVGHGATVELVACDDPRVDLLGFAQQSDPSGFEKDCQPIDEAYSSGPHWYACWFDPLDQVWLAPEVTSANPFLDPTGGVLDGDR